MKIGVRVLAYLVACTSFLPTAFYSVGQPASEAASKTFENAVLRTGGASPGMRLTSGLMVCDEELYNGRWVNRYWTATGQIKPDFHLEGQSQARAGLAADAFQLGIEGQNLAGSWKWIRSEQKHLTNPDGQLVTVELQSTARPITVKLNTLMHGQSVMVRWLDITNTGAKPTAITSVSPWSGVLWETPGLQGTGWRREPL